MIPAPDEGSNPAIVRTIGGVDPILGTVTQTRADSHPALASAILRVARPASSAEIRETRPESDSPKSMIPLDERWVESKSMKTKSEQEFVRTVNFGYLLLYKQVSVFHTATYVGYLKINSRLREISITIWLYYTHKFPIDSPLADRIALHNRCRQWEV